MADYIERKKAIDACFDGWNNNAHDCAENIRLIPAADVRPVVRGKWVQVMGKYDWMVKCSRCNGVPLETSNFCPNCGARMEGE